MDANQIKGLIKKTDPHMTSGTCIYMEKSDPSLKYNKD